MNLFSVSKINIDNNNANSKQWEFPFVVGHAIKLLLHVISLLLSLSLFFFLSHSLCFRCLPPYRFCLTLRLFDIFVFCFAFYFCIFILLLFRFFFFVLIQVCLHIIFRKHASEGKQMHE